MKHLTGMLATAGLALLTAVTPARAQEVKLGVVMANTGTYAFVGTAVINAVRLAFDEMQARNYFGGTKVSLLVEDNRSNTQEALALITRMATRDNAVMVIGPVATGEAMAAAPVANDLKMPIFTTATSPAVLKSGPLANTLGSGAWTVVIILSLVGWTGIYRLVRSEYMKHRSREYVRAAEAIGASHASRMFTHILPNISHVVLVQLSLHVVGFIKAEVILSFLGLGVPIDMVSWGTMLSEAQTELVQGKWWQLVAATVFMASFVTAFALLTDALRDALDPKLR